jgi:ABC-type dipeptide/oligopeptide/nickel transport system permease component
MGRYLVTKIIFYGLLFFLIVLLLSYFEGIFPGRYGDDENSIILQKPEIFKNSIISPRADIFSSSRIDLYMQSFFLDSSLTSLSYGGALVRDIFLEAFLKSFKVFWVSLLFSLSLIIFLFLLSSLFSVENLENLETRESIKKRKIILFLSKSLDWFVDGVLSIPMVFLVPLLMMLFPFIGPHHGMGEEARDFRWFWISCFVSLRGGVFSFELLDRLKKHYLEEPYSRTWIAMGGGRFRLISYWLRPLILKPWLQVLPHMLVHILTGNMLLEIFWQYEGLGSLFVESLLHRDWSLLRPYLLWVSFLFLIFQILVDSFKRGDQEEES